MKLEDIDEDELSDLSDREDVKHKSNANYLFSS